MTCLHLHLPPGSACSYVHARYSNLEPKPPHNHTFLELFWVLSGEGYHWINGERHLMTPGYLSILQAQDCHSFSASREGGNVLFVNFAIYPSLWRRIERRYFAGQQKFFSEPDFRKREWQLDEATLQRVNAFAADLEARFLDPLTVETFLINLFCLLLNRERRREAAKSAPEWLVGARDAIRRFPLFREGVAAFVAYAGRSPEHVARECRKYFGKSPRDLVNEARLDYAAARLSTTNEPILDIIFDAGFENVGHFYQLFRQRFGKSPRRYRLSRHENPQ